MTAMQNRCNDVQPRSGARSILRCPISRIKRFKIRYGIITMMSTRRSIGYKVRDTLYRLS